MITQIGPSIHIKGDLTAHEPLTIAGRIDGSVNAAGHRLIVTEAGSITADIVAHTIVVGGHISGSLDTDGTIIVKRTANIEGNLSAPSVSVDDGAQVQGRFEIVGKRAELSLAS